MDGGDICLICTDPIIDNNDIENNTPYVQCKQCKNKFHDYCISTLFYYNKKNNIETTCPTCRRTFSDVSESDDDDDVSPYNNDPLLQHYMSRVVESPESSDWKKKCLYNFIGTFIIIGGIIFIFIVDDNESSNIKQ